MVNQTAGKKSITIVEHCKMEGEVVSCKMDKTIVVRVPRLYKHPVMGKTVKSYKKYKAHDEQSSAQLGDWVEIAMCRPLSKTKHMMLHRIVRKAK